MPPYIDVFPFVPTALQRVYSRRQRVTMGDLAVVTDPVLRCYPRGLRLEFQKKKPCGNGPHDSPEIAEDAVFNFEDGLLAGLISVRTALRSSIFEVYRPPAS